MKKFKNNYSARIFSFFLSVLILPVFAGSQSYAAESNLGDAIVITSGAQLEQIPIGSTAHYVLANDIDLGQFPAFPMIKEFAGHFDGAGHVIKNLAIPGESDVNKQTYTSLGFFESVKDGAVIENLGIHECYIKSIQDGRDTAGGLIGTVNYNGGKIQIQNCYSSGTVAGKTAGGLIGLLNGDVEMTAGDQVLTNNYNVVVKNCYSTARVTGSEVSGGLVGLGTGGNLINCYNKNQGDELKLIGMETPPANPIITNCYSDDNTSDEVSFDENFYQKLNAGETAYKQDTGESFEALMNSGLPVLSWQKPVCGIDVFMEWYIQGEPSDIVSVTMKDRISSDGQITYSVTGPVNIAETTERVPDRKFFLRFGNDATNGLDQNGTYTLNMKDANGNQQSYSIVIAGAVQKSGTPSESSIPSQDLITVMFNGVPIEFDQPPIIQDDRTLVPMRAIFQTMGATVDWNGDIQTITAVRGDTTIVMVIGNSDITVNNAVIHLDVPPQIVNDRTLVPVRAVAESLNANVEWIEESKTVVIIPKDSKIVNADELMNTLLLDTIGKDTAELSLINGDVTVLSEFDQDNSHYKKIKFANVPFEFSSITVDGKDVICGFSCTYKDIMYIDLSTVSSIDELIAIVPLSLVTRDESSVMFRFINNVYVAMDLIDGKVTSNTVVRVFEMIGV